MVCSMELYQRGVSPLPFDFAELRIRAVLMCMFGGIYDENSMWFMHLTIRNAFGNCVYNREG